MKKTKKTPVKEKKPKKKKTGKIKPAETAEKIEEIKAAQAPKETAGFEIEKKEQKPEHYYEAVGRRKTAIARVRLFTRGEKMFLVNEKPCNIYFPTRELWQTAGAALEKMKCLDRFKVEARVKGGGYHAQSEAIRHATARALVLFNADFKKRLKKSGYLTRDPRMRERKKFGLKRARRAPQWQKR